MSAPIIKAYLVKDIVDSDPQAVFLANQNTAYAWASSSDVPAYMYQSLSTIWTGAPGASATLEDQIVAVSGDGLMGNANYITISFFLYESANAGNDEVEADIPGAENALARILIQPGDQFPIDSSRAQNAELRIRHLLDCNLRSLGKKPNGKRAGESLPVTQSADLSIRDDEIYICRWLRYESDPSTQEIVADYVVTYTRAVGITTIPA